MVEMGRKWVHDGFNFWEGIGMSESAEDTLIRCDYTIINEYACFTQQILFPHLNIHV